MLDSFHMKKKTVLISSAETYKQKKIRRGVAVKAKAASNPGPTQGPPQVPKVLLPPEEGGYLKVGKYDFY